MVVASAALEIPEGGPALGGVMRRYIEHLDAIGTSQFHHTLAVIRAHTADHQGERLSATVPVRDIGTADADVLARLLAGIDLAGMSDQQLGQAAIRSADRVDWLKRRRNPASAEADGYLVRFGPGTFGRDIELTGQRYAMAQALAGAVSVDAAIGALGVERQEMLAFVREGLMRGLFQPAH
jgi:hypothetical protein